MDCELITLLVILEFNVSNTFGTIVSEKQTMCFEYLTNKFDLKGMLSIHHDIMIFIDSYPTSIFLSP